MSKHHRERGYVLLARGDLYPEVAELPTKRRHVLPPSQPTRWAEPTPELLASVLAGLDRLNLDR